MDTMPEDLSACIRFHGHLCPGLALGYVASKEAMKRLGEIFSKDEELVAIVETDACFADAVQVITGCTFGKGNFLFRDYGKMALTLLSRARRKGVRLCLMPEAFPTDEGHLELFKKVMEGKATEEEKERFGILHAERSKKVLEKDPEELFYIREVQVPLPPKARIERSVICDVCGEPTMQSKLKEVGGKKICKACENTNVG